MSRPKPKQQTSEDLILFSAYRWSVVTGDNRPKIEKMLADVTPHSKGPRGENLYTLRQIWEARNAQKDTRLIDAAIKEERLRNEKADADLKELELAKARGEVLGVDIVTRIMAGAIAAIKQVILQTKLSKEDQNAILRELQILKPSDWARDVNGTQDG